MVLKNIKDNFSKTLFAFKQILPILLGTIALVSFFIVVIPKSFYKIVFSGNVFLDSLLGVAIGSLATGNPITSYIIGGELLKEGVSLLAVSAFIMSWVTVGIVQLPAESLMLGRRFAILRNIASFVSAILVSALTILTLSLI